MPEKTDKRRSCAKREFRKVQSDVESRLEQGYSRATVCEELLSEIMESIEPRTETGLNLKAVHRKLEECGFSGYSYAKFCDYFRAAGAYTGREIPDSFMFFDEDGLVTFYYRMASFLEAESDKAAPRRCLEHLR